MVIFLYLCGLYDDKKKERKKEKDKMEIFVAKLLDCTKGLVNFEGIAVNQ